MVINLGFINTHYFFSGIFVYVLRFKGQNDLLSCSSNRCQNIYKHTREEIIYNK